MYWYAIYLLFTSGHSEHKSVYNKEQALQWLDLLLMKEVLVWCRTLPLLVKHWSLALESEVRSSSLNHSHKDCFVQILYAPVMVDISLSDPGRGSIYPPQLKFDPSNWKVQQSVTLNLSSAALSSTESSPFTVNFLLDSSDESIDGQQPKAWVSPPCLIIWFILGYPNTIIFDLCI